MARRARSPPALFEAGTDAMPWRKRGIPVYGIYPYPISPGDLQAMHGNDERVPITGLQAGDGHAHAGGAGCGEVTPLHPAVEPDADGRLDVGDGQRMYWEASGNPDGEAGAVPPRRTRFGLHAEQRRFFDPAAYRVVLFDQRGCGRSTPTRATRPPSSRSTRRGTWSPTSSGSATTSGSSAGSCSASPGARRSRSRTPKQHPERVSELVLAVGGADAARGYRLALPRRGAAVPRRVRAVPGGRAAAERDGDLVAAYHRLLGDTDPGVRARAADEWSAWELAVMSTEPDPAWPAVWRSRRSASARARLVTHYFRHGGWLEPGPLLRDAGSLAGIPGDHGPGRLDLGSQSTPPGGSTARGRTASSSWSAARVTARPGWPPRSSPRPTGIAARR